MAEAQTAAAGRAPRAGAPGELTFSLPAATANPYWDATVRVTLCAPDGLRTTLFAFWDGEDIWRARFLPLQSGVHGYRVEATGGERPRQFDGEVQVGEPLPGNSLLAHGPIQVAGDRKTLRHRDGTPFFWLADTWWYGATVRCRWPEDFRLLAEDRARKGFTVIQMVVGVPPEIGPDDPSARNEGGEPFERRWDKINPRYFEFVDKRVQCLVDNGLTPCIVGGWGHHIDWMGVEAMTRYWQYLVARYAAYPVVWCLSGESEYQTGGPAAAGGQSRSSLAVLKRWVSGRLPERLAARLQDIRPARAGQWAAQTGRWAERRRAWESVGQAVAWADPYHHVITTHPVVGRYSHQSLNNASWVGLTGIQSGHAATSAFSMVRSIERAGAFEPRRPIINLEPWYEGILGQFWADDQRYAFWLCLLAGAAGHTYGANGVWQMGTEAAPFLAHWGQADWRQAYQQPGAEQLGMARRFLGRLRGWELEPRLQWIEPHWGEGRERQPYLAAIRRDVFVAYFPSTEQQFNATIAGLLPGRAYRACWFDPRTGTTNPIGAAAPSRSGLWRAPRRPDSQDWVLLIEREGPFDEEQLEAPADRRHPEQ